jgi:hypothetical protein
MHGFLAASYSVLLIAAPGCGDASKSPGAPSSGIDAGPGDDASDGNADVQAGSDVGTDVTEETDANIEASDAPDSCGNGACDPNESATSCPADCCPMKLETGVFRGGNTPTMTRPSYDYVPSVMHDGVYRMWWCGGVAGDHILYAEASSLDGPWHARGSSTPGSFDDVLQPTGNPADFDGVHVCDPSVIRVSGRYYLYYGGYPLTGEGETTRIGVAESDDGMTWTRMNGGKPIIEPATDFQVAVNKYGAGQPSVTFVDDHFVLAYTDTTGRDINPGNGAGIFVLRSKDPTFQTGVEELGATGFEPRDPATSTSHKLIESFSVDWQYVDAIDAYALASHTASAVTRIHFFDKPLTASLGTVEIPGAWTEGPGLVSRPDKHAVPSSDCGTVPFDVMRSVGPGGPDTWDLAHLGVDLLTSLDCECVPVGRVFEGSLLESPGLPLTLVRDRGRLQFALPQPAQRLARSRYTVSPEVFHLVPFAASLVAAAPVLGADGRPAAFKLDGDRLWPVSCLDVITDNGSSIEGVSTSEWDALPKGPALHCLR